MRSGWIRSRVFRELPQPQVDVGAIARLGQIIEAAGRFRPQTPKLFGCMGDGGDGMFASARAPGMKTYSSSCDVTRIDADIGLVESCRPACSVHGAVLFATYDPAIVPPAGYDSGYSFLTAANTPVNGFQINWGLGDDTSFAGAAMPIRVTGIDPLDDAVDPTRELVFDVLPNKGSIVFPAVGSNVAVSDACRNNRRVHLLHRVQLAHG